MNVNWYFENSFTKQLVIMTTKGEAGTKDWHRSRLRHEDPAKDGHGGQGATGPRPGREGHPGRGRPHLGGQDVLQVSSQKSV